ncbi:hypothetical protein N9Z54_03025 [Planctomycetota bacterium]|nr:hypothetical protein [Planctomycetota bacterium]
MKLFSIPTALVTAGLASIALAVTPPPITDIGDAEATSLQVLGATLLEGDALVSGANLEVFGGRLIVRHGMQQIFQGSLAFYNTDPVTGVETRNWLRPGGDGCGWRIDVGYVNPVTQRMTATSNGFE